MTSLNCSATIIRRYAITEIRLPRSGLWKMPKLEIPKPQHSSTFPITKLKKNHLRCANLLPWEDSSPYAPREDISTIVKGSNIVEPIDSADAPELPMLQSESDVIDMRNLSPLQLQPLKWPMWLMGPSVLLATGIVPTLWLPLSSVFMGPNIAGLLSLVGLDCIFNMGATLFLLMSDACAHPNGSSSSRKSEVPLTYKLWNLGASLLGFIVPLVMLFASYKGTLQPHLPFISFSVLLGPYLLLLCIQILTEMLTWHWKSPVWLMAPVVYESYRVLQLMRGLKLAVEVGAPAWTVESIRGLVSWWILILGVQLMRVAWFAGLASPTEQQNQGLVKQ